MGQVRDCRCGNVRVAVGVDGRVRLVAVMEEDVAVKQGPREALDAQTARQIPLL